MTVSFEKLPARISEYLGSHFTTIKNLKLAERYKLNDDQLHALALQVAHAFMQEYELKDLPNVLKTALKLDSGTAFMLATETAEQHFVAFADHLGDSDELRELWQQWGSEFGGQRPPASTPGVDKMIAENERVNKEQELQVSAPPKKQRKELKQQGASGKRASLDLSVAKKPRSPVIEKTNGSTDKLHFLEQLQGMNIQVLRKDGQAATESLDKVLQTIQGVIEQRPTERAAITQALNNSSLLALYKEQGQEIVRAGATADQIIYKRYQEKRPYLLKEEFDAVAQIINTVR